MKYQALKRLKTKTKLLKLCDTLKEAHDIIRAEGAVFQGFSYVGGFPMYQKTATNQDYSIQGLHEELNIVLSLSEEEKRSFNFNQ